nr:hypothetical protein BaRGS_018516 [Batillaria attramentaria]
MSYSSASGMTAYPGGGLPGSAHPTHYYSEFDWQQQSSAAAAAVAAAAASDPAALYCFPAERPDLAQVQLYHTFPGVPAPDLYSAPALWHSAPGLMEDASHVNALAAQRYLPGVGLSRGSSTSSSTTQSGSTGASGKPKRRRVQSHAQRKAANIRERRRMFHLNTAFDELRKRLPAFNYEKRLSRIETLRLAMTYIGFMKDVMMGEDPRKVKLRNIHSSEGGSDLSHGMDLESCTSDDVHHEDLDS